MERAGCIDGLLLGRPAELIDVGRDCRVGEDCTSIGGDDDAVGPDDLVGCDQRVEPAVGGDAGDSAVLDVGEVDVVVGVDVDAVVEDFGGDALDEWCAWRPVRVRVAMRCGRTEWCLCSVVRDAFVSRSNTMRRGLMNVNMPVSARYIVEPSGETRMS